MDPIIIIQKFYDVDSRVYRLLVWHSQAVTKKALEIARRIPHLNPDLKFIEEATMLHDIGIFLTYYPKLWCFGDKPYICHGYIGKELLEKEGLLRHALVCERHIGMGLSAQDIQDQNIPLPPRDMLPISIEEKIICIADKFFSKTSEPLTKEKSIEEIKDFHRKFGKDKKIRFETWMKELWI